MNIPAYFAIRHKVSKKFRGYGKTLAVRTVLKKYIDKLPLDALERMYNVAIDYLNEGD